MHKVEKRQSGQVKRETSSQYTLQEKVINLLTYNSNKDVKYHQQRKVEDRMPAIMPLKMTDRKSNSKSHSYQPDQRKHQVDTHELAEES